MKRIMLSPAEQRRMRAALVMDGLPMWLKVKLLADYYLTDWWRRISGARLVFADGLCEFHGCRRRATQVHHREGYSRVFCERLTELWAVCREHHAELHGIKPGPAPLLDWAPA